MTFYGANDVILANVFLGAKMSAIVPAGATEDKVTAETKDFLGYQGYKILMMMMMMIIKATTTTTMIMIMMMI